MNCCDYDCNQGRDCPARAPVCKHCYGIGYDASGLRCTCDEPAKVAKVGKRMHARQPLRGTTWRNQLKDLARAMLLVVAVMFFSAVTVGVMR